MQHRHGNALIANVIPGKQLRKKSVLQEVVQNKREVTGTETSSGVSTSAQECPDSVPFAEQV